MADADKNSCNKIITGDETRCFAYDPETSYRVLNGLVRHPLGRRNWNSEGPASRPCWYFFFRLSRRSAQRIPTRGKTVNVEFCNGVKDRLLKRIQRVRSAAFCCRDFFLLNHNASAHKAASVCQFLTLKCYNPLSPPYSPDLSPPDYFLFPKEKIKLKGLHFADLAETQEAVTDELKKVHKEEFSAALQKLYDREKACIYANGAYFELKKVCVFLTCLRYLKKSVLNLLDRTVYVPAYQANLFQYVMQRMRSGLC